MRQKRRAAVYATLLTQFGVTEERLALLTDWQIHRLFWHKRNKKGEIDIPGWEPGLLTKAGPPTLEGDLKAVEFLSRALGGFLKPADVEEAKAKLREKYAAAESQEGDDGEGGRDGGGGDGGPDGSPD